jgi:hypothetical protein
MTSRADQLVASPTWGGEEREEVAPRRAAGAVRFGLRGSFGADAAGTVLVLAATGALWAAFLVAVW